jgi:Kef-type K+ transport system membrane component KefB/nucleotide-binding universal stress UspA family protein
MAVGPYGLNLLDRDASFRIFGEVGILYLMFLAAVEIDMYHLKQNLRKGVIFGLITFLLPMIVGIIASRYAFGVGWTTSVLLASMYASHTLISYPIINRFGLANSRSVVIAICGTIVAVMLALVMLAEVVAVRTHGSVKWLDLLSLLGMVAVYAVVIGYTFPIMARRFFRSVNDSVTQFIFVLALVFVASLLAQIIGLESILGAFFAGLVLNRYIPSRSVLMNRIEFVGNAVFIPYFLIGVGMLININVIIKGWGVVWVAANMIAVALLCKWLAAYIAQKMFGMTSRGRNILFGLTSGKAAATIAATMVGYKYGLLNEDMMNGAVLMILVCCAVSSIVTQRAAIKLRMNLTEENLKHDTVTPRRNARQLVAVVNPITAEGIMKLAILMRHPKNDLPMTALFVRSNDEGKVVTMGRNALRAAVEVANAVDIPVNEIERYDLNVVAGLINVMKEKEATDLIIGMHRKSNVVDSFYGSLIEKLLSSSNKMIVMSRCFIPVNTVARLVIFVPQKAEYETGFRLWVERIGNLSTQLGCKAVFMAYADTVPYIQGVLNDTGYTIRCEYRDMTTWDDFIVLSTQIRHEDLLIIIGARRSSISFSSDLENIPSFLSRYFSNHNLLVMYPEQFGANEDMPTPIDPLAQSLSVEPSPLTVFAKKIAKLIHHS